MKGFLMLLIFGFIIFSGYYIAVHDKKVLGPRIITTFNEIKKAVGIDVAPDQDVYCALQSLSPGNNSHLKSPITISVVVNNTIAHCDTWTVFEGQAGIVELHDEYGGILDTGALKTTSDWASGFPATYTTSLSNFIYTGKATLVFKEEDPSGQGKSKESFITVFIDDTYDTKK